MLALPDPLPETDLVEPAPVDKTAFVSFDGNRYSVPSIYADKTLTLVASDTTIRLSKGKEEVARHVRSWGRRQVIEAPEHRAELLEHKRAAREAKGRDRLVAAIPGFDILVDMLRSIGVRVSREALLALIAHATTARLSPVQTFEDLVAIARRERDQRNLAARTKAATIGTFKPLDRFDWNHPRTIPRELIEELCTLDFIAKGHNVLLRGPSGVGKTMLAQNLGMLALEHGHTVRFTTLSAALADLLKQESMPALERRLRKYTAPSLLILDEIGYLPCTRQSADLLYNIISRRHEAKSLVLTTNLPFKQWSMVFPGAACVSAMIDRFVQHCHIVDIDADSWRQKESLAMTDTRPKPKHEPPEALPKKR